MATFAHVESKVRLTRCIRQERVGAPGVWLNWTKYSLWHVKNRLEWTLTLAKNRVAVLKYCSLRCADDNWGDGIGTEGEEAE